MGKILTLEEGITQIVESIEKIVNRPILAAVYGYPDRGKSYLIDILTERLKQKELLVIGYGSAPTADEFESIRRHVNWDAYIFHCAWNRSDFDFYKEVSGHEDPNILAKNILGREMDLNIAICNPNLISACIDPRNTEQLYDFIIVNPDAVQK